MSGSDPTDRRDSLTIRWKADGAIDLGELIVEAHAHGYAGRSSGYFNAQEVLDFAARLTEYPLAHEPLEIRTGYLRKGTNEVDEHIGITISTVGNLGQVGVFVHLTEVWPARPETRSEVRLGLLTTYERLRRFGPELARVVRGDQGEARVDGEALRT